MRKTSQGPRSRDNLANGSLWTFNTYQHFHESPFAIFLIANYNFFNFFIVIIICIIIYLSILLTSKRGLRDSI